MNKHASAGGRARAAKLSPERRREIARQAALTRWGDANAPRRTKERERRARINRLKTARDRVNITKRKFSETLKAHFPKGTQIFWERPAGVVQYGTVTDHAYGPRLKVCNVNTGAEYWITGYDITG